MKNTKGFITLATGNEYYYKLAVNLYRSYKIHGGELPFAILCDRRNKYTEVFDEVVVLSKVNNNYLDKFELFLNLPYDENFFIEPDCLIYKNIDSIFESFENAPDFCALEMNIAPLGSDGWFVPKEPILKQYPYLNSFLGFNPGYMFFRKSSLMELIYQDCVQISAFLQSCEQYDDNNKLFFNGVLRDDPVIWLATMKNNCYFKINTKDLGKAVSLPGSTVLNISHLEDKLDIIDHYNDTRHDNNFLLHFSTRRTQEGLYSHQLLVIRMMKYKVLKPLVWIIERPPVMGFYVQLHKFIRGLKSKMKK